MRSDEPAESSADLDIEFAWESRPAPPPPKVKSPRRRTALLAAAVAVVLVAGAAMTIALTQGGKPDGATVHNAAAQTKTVVQTRSTTLVQNDPTTIYVSVTGSGSGAAVTPLPPSSDAPNPAPSNIANLAPAQPRTNNAAASTRVAPPAASSIAQSTQPAKATTPPPPAQQIPAPANPVPIATTPPFVSTSYAALPGTWPQCAVENATCTINGTRVIAFGQGGGFAYGTFSTATSCSPSVFGNTSNPAPMACYQEYLPQVVPNLWTQCAGEGGNCPFAGVMTVAFGANGHYNFATLGGGGTACSNTVFGDPAVGNAKACYLMAPMHGFTHWISCAPENSTCKFSGRQEVAFGDNQGSYSYGFFDSSTPCTLSVFGDPAPGVAKTCYYQNY